MNFRRILTALIILVASVSGLNGLVTVDFSQDSYSSVLTQLSNIGLEHVEAVVVRHPFWHLHGKSDKEFGVYNWDLNIPSRAQQSPSAGSLSELNSLADYLHKKKIRLYSRIDPFIQIKDFDKNWWELKDFSYDSIQFGKYNLVSPAGSDKLGSLFHAMKSMPIDRWIVNLDNVPVAQQTEYAGIARRGLGPRILLMTSFTNKIGNYSLLQAADYWTLREGPFLTPIPELSAISNFKASHQKHIIDSDKLTINNIATTVYMLSQDLSVVIPASFIRHKGIAHMIQALQSKDTFKLKLLSDKTMLLYSRNQIISFHLGDEMNMIKIPSLITNKGDYNSVVGNSILHSENDLNYFLLFPGSVYLWEIK